MEMQTGDATPLTELRPVADRVAGIFLPCNHLFCPDCVPKWLHQNPGCPLCRRLCAIPGMPTLEYIWEIERCYSLRDARNHIRHTMRDFIGFRGHLRCFFTQTTPTVEDLYRPAIPGIPDHISAHPMPPTDFLIPEMRAEEKSADAATNWGSNSVVDSYRPIYPWGYDPTTTIRPPVSPPPLSAERRAWLGAHRPVELGSTGKPCLWHRRGRIKYDAHDPASWFRADLIWDEDEEDIAIDLDIRHVREATRRLEERIDRRRMRRRAADTDARIVAENGGF